MIFPGNNKIVLTQEAMCRAVEDALNGAMKAGEDYIRVTEIRSTYSWGDFDITITTDKEEKSESISSEDSPNIG